MSTADRVIPGDCGDAPHKLAPGTRIWGFDGQEFGLSMGEGMPGCLVVYWPQDGGLSYPQTDDVVRQGRRWRIT